MKNKSKVLIKSLERLKKSNWKRNYNLLETLWIKENENINILNYIYYKHFSNSFRDFLIDRVSNFENLDELTKKELDELKVPKHL